MMALLIFTKARDLKAVGVCILVSIIGLLFF